MITPMRFGLKYAPVPTLALEYEDDLAPGVDDGGGGSTSLYVHAPDDRNGSQMPVRAKKLHVVELPALTRQSEPVAVARQLQQANRRFLAPDVVNEHQLVRLLERLMAHLEATERYASTPIDATTSSAQGLVAAQAVAVAAVAAAATSGESESESESELEASAMSESLADSHGDGDGAGDDQSDSKVTTQLTIRARAASDSGSDDGDGVDLGDGDIVGRSLSVAAAAADSTAIANSPDVTPTARPDDAGSDDNESERQQEATDDAAKRAVLRRADSPSDAASDDDVASEDLEYFSDDASDEDSF